MVPGPGSVDGITTKFERIRAEVLNTLGVSDWAFPIAVAGGFVRDRMVGNEPRDIDLYVLKMGDVGSRLTF